VIGKLKKKNFTVRNVRIHKDFIQRLEALTPHLEAMGEYAPGGILKEGDKLRLALCAGIEALEKRVRGAQ
jgi:hypothetical protein